MKLSVLIPVYNEEGTVKDLLDHVLAVPVEKEIVIVDDCSTDDSYEHARAVAKKWGGRLKVIRNRVNMGKRRSIIRATRER